MDENTAVYNKLRSFCDVNKQFCYIFEETEKLKKLKRKEKNEFLLEYIADKIFVVPQFFESVYDHFASDVPKLLFMSIFPNKAQIFCVERHRANCVLLSKVLRYRKDLFSYGLKYFGLFPYPFYEEMDYEACKRSKTTQQIQITDLEIAEACYVLLKSDPEFYRTKWFWMILIKKFLNHVDSEVRFITCHCLSILLGMNEPHLEKLIKSKISTEEHLVFNVNFNLNLTLTEKCNLEPTLEQHPVISPSPSQHVRGINICGIFLPTVSQPVESDAVLQVPSTYSNLQKIVLGLSSNRAICLQGPVGSGKTSLVEYLAARTGRVLGKDFIKMQLGDQTDSKMLLGTYRCTDMAGEFVWEPGVLTQAVVEGSWLLLEDIDSASMDIASVLTSLLENRTLTVPGYRDSVPVAPSFQLFLTQRLITTLTGHHKTHSNAVNLLEKYLLRVNIDPLTADELKQIVDKRFVSFKTISSKLISTFQLFTDNTRSDSAIVSIHKTGRTISTRDFFKWCYRSSIGFNVKSQESALTILQNAIDVFCCSNANLDEALNLAMEISTHLGIINQKAEFFFKNYKPNMQLTSDSLVAGRVSLQRENNRFSKQTTFSFTRPSAVLLERVMCCVKLKEPVLLVGETGTGKTSSIQYLAHTIGQKLVVINMNQQSDSADLLGGFKPVDVKFIITPLKREFETLFCEYFKVESNKKYLSNIAYCFNNQRWSALLALMRKSTAAAQSRLTSECKDVEKKLKNETLLKRWNAVAEKLHKVEVQIKQKCALAFAFIEGSLVKAVQNGYWVLLDEINLANAETLECLSGLLEGSDSSLYLLERGDKEPVRRHPNFTLFACMNPSTDVGKKDLPIGIRNRFTEFFVHELTEKSDLILLVNGYLEALALKQRDVGNIVDFYLRVRKEAVLSLCDGLGHKPHFSLRSLCRALTIAGKNPCGMLKRSLYEAFCVSFLTQLDAESYKQVESLISRYLIGDEKTVKAVLKQPIPMPQKDGNEYIQFEGYWLKKGDVEPSGSPEYILTESVRRNLKDLVRIVAIGKLPVLLQGATSVGKTSLITYLAKSSGNKCVRINNHEHTDLQEYIGSYVADTSGKLTFREGLLVEAMRKGHWIILDELNLAPTEVLEALNRVLDDNRELFIPETQEVVKADPNFMLFATQNPPGAYGGRKMLSRAFRNRFVELHFNEIPPKELEFILHMRCELAPSYAKKMVSVMTDLQTRRRGSAAFAGKQGFITLRDLFRWGERYRLAPKITKFYDWDQHLADEGYLVLAGRVRKPDEKNEIIEVLRKHLKRDVVPHDLFTLNENTSVVTRHILSKIHENNQRFHNIVWTYNMRQLAVLVAKALEFKEPVLLVGETGGGKTTVCQLLADINGRELITVNCHMHTESSDFIGGLRPVRDHSENSSKLFEWVDGPLLQAMVKGDFFLADEISLADDSVLERLNSLLEPERFLLLAEKGVDMENPNHSELITAHPNFVFIGTMNPGGDFGKKELSPALRNRFTEIWCEPNTERSDLIAIIEKNIKCGLSLGNQEDGTSGIGSHIMEFVDWFRGTDIGRRCTVSIRDILTWVNFLNATSEYVDVAEGYVHGACVTFIHSLGAGLTSSVSSKVLTEFKAQCTTFVVNQMKAATGTLVKLENLTLDVSKGKFCIGPFSIDMGPDVECEKTEFSFDAPKTKYNTLSLVRGMQLNKAILLEGSPGVGKTSLVIALAKMTRHKIFRVNLSDQTDISDLFGADLPVEGGSGGQFSWRDGPFLQALKEGKWILLDELNLASQSVLEGLNACLDHRGEVFVPELGKTFHVRPGTRFFACQNPLKQGGSRRGLPRSFLNRFIQVFVDSLTPDDFLFILSHQFKELPMEILQNMVKFNGILSYALGLKSNNFAHKGAPWECNLRDLTRWCEATIFHYRTSSEANKKYAPERTAQLIYSDRMRTESDKDRVFNLFGHFYGCEIAGDDPKMYLNSDRVFFGDVSLRRHSDAVNSNVLRQGDSYLVLRNQIGALRSLAYCVNMNWMSILVGSSASGKSSVVKTLSNLAGKCLRTLAVTSAMDTTDILGGFEQVDYTRHLDEISRKTELLLLETLQQLFLKSDENKALVLLDYWESYLLLSRNKTQTMEEECKLFLHKCSKLIDIMDRISIVVNEEKKKYLATLKEKADFVHSCVKKEGSLNSGGKFEWVDSVLIKCLQEGSWLLIDNVNLCSAAVLDRLNGLLETNGVLTIAEKGVDQNGQMVEIKPHPSFRLFLTMDPKNGEISRAMRNRGVEIYLLGDETCFTDEYDIKSLINLQGLPDPTHISALLQIHNSISNIILGEKPHLNDILQCSSLISQQMLHGIDDTEAFSTAVIEVYYKSRSPLEFNCVNTVEYIREEVKNKLNADVGSDDSDLYHENVSLKTDKLESCSQLEKIKHQSSVLFYYIAEPRPYFNLISQILINIHTITSCEDFSLRIAFLIAILQNTRYAELSRRFSEIFSKLHVHDRKLPIDFYWNSELPYSVKDETIVHKLNLALLIISDYFQEGLYNNLREAAKERKEIPLLDYMYERIDDKIEDHFNNVIINKYLELMKEYDAELNQLYSKISKVSEDDVMQIVYLMTWKFVFHRVMLDNIKNITPNEVYNLLMNIAVHYKWFYKYAVKKVFDITNVPIPEKLESTLLEINSDLEKRFSFVHKISKNYRKFENIPPPFINENQITAVRTFNEINMLYDTTSPRINAVNVINILKQNGALRKALVDAKCALDYDFSDASTHITLINALHENVVTEEKITKYETEIIPFLDVFLRTMLTSSFVSLGEQCFSNVEVEHNIMVPTELSGLISRYKKDKDPRNLDELFKCFYLYLVNSAAVKPTQYLKEKEDDNVLNVSSFNPLLTCFMSRLLLREDKITPTTLGNFKDLEQQRGIVGTTVWANFEQLAMEKYDFVYCETQILLNNCRSVSLKLAKSLNIENINDDIPLNELIDNCITTLKDKRSSSGASYVETYQSNSSEDLTEDQQIDFLKNKDFLGGQNSDFIEILRMCSSFVKELSTCTNTNEKLLLISNLHIYLSLFKMLLNSKLPVIDPLVKKTLKKKYCSEAIDKFTDIKSGFDVQNGIFCNTDSTHSYRDAAQRFVKRLEEKNENLEKYVAFRPSDVLYSTVLKTIERPFETILSANDVYKVIVSCDIDISPAINAVDTEMPINHEDARRSLAILETAVLNYSNLIEQWKPYSASYPDVIEPLLSSASELLYGVQMKTFLFKKVLMENKNLQIGVDLNKVLVDLVVVPSLNKDQGGYECLIANCTSKKFLKFIDSSLGENKRPEQLRLLNITIQESFNHCIFEANTTNSLNKALFEQFTKLVDIFITAWTTQEEEKELLKEESQSLYKTRTKCEEKPEQEQINDELKQLFPNFHTIDFFDMQKDADFTDQPEESNDNEYTAQISIDDLRNVIRMHTILLTHTKTEWLNPPKTVSSQPDLIQPLVEKYKLFKKILDNSAMCLDYTMDKKLLGSLSLFLYVARKHGDVTDLNEHASPSRLQVNKRRDFYKDPNVEEVKSCCHILDELRLKINQLLEEWPDQPTLKTIETIIDRIYGFSVTSPVARFLTGFELLLSKCNEWEQVAHSGVTLNEFSQRLTHQIIEWRKLELNMWKDLLNITFERLNEPLSKWWLYLYNISKQFIFEKRFTRQDLLETLQTFITKSNLAEFQGRLELLHTFHCHAVYLERTTETEAFISILWNVYSYFLQFGPAVANKIKDLRAPVEKKLKDYVKIVRWKDISYWAIKETVEKSHRTLHKYIREFRELLSQPVSTCLVNIPSSQLSENIGIWDRPQRQYPKTYHYTLDPDSYVTKLSLLKKIEPGFDPSSEILSKLDSYFLRSRKLCKEIISSTEYPGLVQSLETFVVEVIESSSHLQKLEVNTTLPKDKQKSQAKSILQQKQRSLSDLFKNLIKIGISFRAGIVGLKLKNDVDDFLLKPLDLSSSIKHLPHNRTDEKIMTIWDSCEIYYNKSRMRIDVLETALKNPAKDLGIANVERCKGFAAHLSTLIRNQKQQFITSSRLQYYLRYYIHQITEICNGTDFLPKTVITNLTNLLKNIVIVMNQYKLVLSSCPEDKSGSEQVEVILLPGKSSDIQFKHSENWTNAYNSINSILSAATKLSGNLQKYVGHVPSVDCELIAPCFIPVPNLKELENELLKLHETLGNLKQLIGNSNLSDSVLWLMEETVKISNQLEQSPASDPVSTEEFIKTIESCINKVLLVIQNVYKKYSKATNSEESDCREEEEETEYQLMEEHLKIHLMQNLFSDMDLLEMTSVFDAVAQIASIMLTSSPDVLNECRYMTVRCLPLLEQVIQMYQYFVTQQVSCYRVSCKLASVLFNIFIDLVSKGFCTPPEFADDTGKEGESKPSDGLGLGEGEGQRDVSDKIESEDQLEDAQPADKGQEEGEDPDCKEDDNGIEMSEDFDSKLQDKKPEDPDDENGSDEDNSDADEQMGETDKGADQLDEEIWGSDKDEEEGENEGSEETQDKGQVDGPDELGAKESDSKNKKEDKDKGSFEEQDEEQNKKEINEMGDPEYDDEQTDPYHGNQPELPEPEPMDLPDDLQLDDGQEKDSEQPEENPFDIDTMKEQNVPENKDEESAGPEQEEPSKNDEENDFSSDDEDILKTNADNGVEETEEPEKSESESKEKQMEESNLEVEDEENDDEDGLSNEQTGMDQSDTAEQHVEAMEVDNAESKDNVTQPSNSENQKSSQPIDELFQEDNPDNEGVGQSQMEETKSGHTAQTNVAQNLESMGRDVEQEMEKQKPGESDDKRSLGDTSEPVKKKMKTIDSKDTQKEASEMDEEMSMQAPEMYQHIKEAEKETTQILDTATKEQAEQQKEAVQDENETDEETADSSNTLQHEKDEDIDVIDTEQQSSEKLEKMKDSSKNKRQHLEGEVLEEMKDIDVEGETVQTSTVPRGGDSFHHTNYSKLQETTASRLSIEDINTLRGDVEKQLSSWTEPPSSVEAEQAWQKISSVTLSLAQDLSEQLRLVLEPTKTSRLKGDYRTGRRINMRKIIPYIASQFRKDKIWLRRTKPAKREYQIVLAIDDSSSMADNHSKELAFESVALISKALTLLESGQLSVVSFGENIEVLHKLTDQFSEKSGAIFLQKFLFDQQKTCVAKLVDFATEMFNQTQIQSSVLNAKLLVIVSDGRGVFSEGEMYVRDAVRRATLSNVFMVFVIIDNPENKNSVLDIRKPVFKDGKLLGIENYMDEFPFSFYIILKDINSLPSVLSDALRQWFEIVSNLDKQ